MSIDGASFGNLPEGIARRIEAMGDVYAALKKIAKSSHTRGWLSAHSEDLLDQADAALTLADNREGT